MTPVEQALEIIMAATPRLDSEIIAFTEAVGRVLYSDIISPVNIPGFDNSAMDGYALKHEESSGASPENPRTFTICGEIQAGGEPSRARLEPGTAIRIMTGAPMPPGADAVIPVEDTAEEGNILSIMKPLAKHENVRFAGEDIAAGDTALRKGRRLTSADVGLLASLNCTTLEVYRRPAVAIITTGDEVVEPGEELKEGQVRNSNAYTLLCEVAKYGGVPRYLGIARDNREETAEMFKGGLDADVVITTGGVSMGRYDFVKDVMARLGVDIKIETIRMKPGKPVVFGQKGNTLFFGLPGNPVSTMVSFLQFVRPALLLLAGSSTLDKPLLEAVLDNPLKKKPGRRHYIRGYFSIRHGRLHVTTTGPQGSGILRSMSIANCLIILPEDVTGVEAGEKVMIQLIDHGEI